MVTRQSWFSTLATGSSKSQDTSPIQSASAPAASTPERTSAAAGGYVTYNFCSELGWSPCTAAQAPKLTIWYRP